MSKPRKNPPQITGRVTRAERLEFEDYARNCGLDAAGLLALLWAREMRVDRLKELVRKAPPTNPPLDTKVTAHIRDAEFRTKVLCAAERAGVSVSRACAELMRTELQEEWLETAFLPTRFESRRDRRCDRIVCEARGVEEWRRRAMRWQRQDSPSS